MVIGKNSHFSCAANFLRGRKCVFCGSFTVYKTSRGYVKCGRCGKVKSLAQLRRELAILRGFYQLQPAYRLAHDLALDVKTITRVYQRLREVLYHTTELEGGKLKGEIELDEAYFRGRRKGKRGRGAAGKRLVFGLLERDGRVYTKVIAHASAEELRGHIEAKTRKGSVYLPMPSGVISRSSVTGNIIRLIIPSHWWISVLKTISMALKGFGAMPSIFCITIAVCQSIISRCILRKSNTVIITETKTSLNSLLTSTLVSFLPNSHNLGCIYNRYILHST